MQSLSQYILEKKSTLVTVDDPIAQEIEQGFLANCEATGSTVDRCAVIPSTEVAGKYDVVMTHGVPMTVGGMQIVKGCGDWYTKVNYIYKENGKDASRFAVPIYCNGTHLRDDSEVIKLPKGVIGTYNFACDIDKFDFKLPKDTIVLNNANIKSYGKFSIGYLKLPIFVDRYSMQSKLDIDALISAGGKVDRIVLGKATLIKMGVNIDFGSEYDQSGNYTNEKGRVVKILPPNVAEAINKIMTGLNANSGKYVFDDEFGPRNSRFRDKSQFGPDANCEIIRDPKSGKWAVIGDKAR